MNRYRVDVALSAGQTYKGITAGIVGVQVEATSEQEAINKALREVGAKFWKEIHLLEEADPDLRTYEVGLTKEGEDITVRVDAASQGLAIRDAVVQNRGWIWNKKIHRVNEAPSPTVTGESITTVEGAHNGLKITSTGKLQQVRIIDIDGLMERNREAAQAALADLADARWARPWTPATTEGEELTLLGIIGQAIGTGSMCWSETPQGTFDSEKAQWVAGGATNEIEKWISRRDNEPKEAGVLHADIPNIELSKATAEKECGMAVLSDEGKAIAAQHAEDSLNLIDLILHYRNPADDAARLRQIRIVME